MERLCELKSPGGQCTRMASCIMTPNHAPGIGCPPAPFSHLPLRPKHLPGGKYRTHHLQTKLVHVKKGRAVGEPAISACESEGHAAISACEAFSHPCARGSRPGKKSDAGSAVAGWNSHSRVARSPQEAKEEVKTNQEASRPPSQLWAPLRTLSAIDDSHVRA